MLLHIIAHGRMNRTSGEAELIERYLKRLRWPARITELPERGGPLPPPGHGPARLVALDERGTQMTSEGFAALLGRWRDEAVRECRFLIGAAHGHDAATRVNADLLIAFGAMTWPHMLARAMLVEQLWRATSILAGHPYHRAG